ncbi:MAG: FlgB family protein [Neomegalonema sp.]|nr:FlgB family protein [Neomegalonema sp.]
MADSLSILNLASALARHSAQRHKVVAENIANADTPGYKARDVERFDAEKALRAKKRGEMRSLQGRVAEMLIEDVQASPNGNTVSIEDQMVRATEAQASHDAAISIYRKSMDLMRMSLGRK